MNQEKYPIPRKQPAYFSALNAFIDGDATIVQRANSRLVFERIADRWDGFRAAHGKPRAVKTPEQKEQAKRAKRDREFAQSHIWDAIIGSDQVVPELKAAALRQKRALQHEPPPSDNRASPSDSRPPPSDSRASPPLTKRRRVQEQSDNDDDAGGGDAGGDDDGEYEDDEPVSENGRRANNDGNADTAESDEQTDREQQSNEAGRHVETFEDSDQSSEPFADKQRLLPQTSTPPPPITQPLRQTATTASNGVQTRSRARAIRQQLRKKVPVKALENLKKKFNELAKAMDISRDEDIVKTFEEMFQLALNQTKVIETVDEIVAEIEE